MSRDLTALPPIPASQRIRYGAAPSQFMDIWSAEPESARGCAVMIHGGFWRAKYDLSHAGHLCAALAVSGVAVASLEYTRVGQPGGGWPGTYRDILAGLKVAREYFAAAPVVLGHSAGGHLALRAASDFEDMRGVLALAAVSVLQIAYDLNLSDGAVREFLGGTPIEAPEIFEEACPSRHASSVAKTLIHGTNDEVVPIEISRAFVAARVSDPAPMTLAEIEGANHFDLIDPQSHAWPTVLDHVLRFLQ